MLAVSCLILLDSENAFLAAKRPLTKSLGGFWEFPGGKVEAGEEAEDAVRRELREELNLVVDALQGLTPVTHRYEFGSIRLIPFVARCTVRPALQLVEHSEVRWVDAVSAQSLEWAPADLPILAELLRLLESDAAGALPASLRPKAMHRANADFP